MFNAPADAFLLTSDTKRCCPVCGKIQYDFGSDHELHIDAAFLAGEQGICRTPAMFGGWNPAMSLPVLSQDVYQDMIAQGLRKDLAFEPVYLETRSAAVRLVTKKKRLRPRFHGAAAVPLSIFTPHRSRRSVLVCRFGFYTKAGSDLIRIGSSGQVW